MKVKAERLEALAKVISDYREGEIPARTPDVIEAWLRQFPTSTRGEFLEALISVLGRTYISRDEFKGFLTNLASLDKLSQERTPSDYWLGANIFNIQQGGNSQKEMLAMFDEVMQDTHGFGLDQTGSDEGDFVYLDDCIGTGSRIRNDIFAWLPTITSDSIKLNVITAFLYTGSYWAFEQIKKRAKELGKSITITKWRVHELKNQRNEKDDSDVLWPSEIPNTAAVQAYVTRLAEAKHSPILRSQAKAGAAGVFENDAQRKLLEQAFLQRGCEVREASPNLTPRARPLGYHTLDCLGFGSMFITYRNCPNNCPLVFWVHQEDYPPLFPRKTNAQTSLSHEFAGLDWEGLLE